MKSFKNIKKGWAKVGAKEIYFRSSWELQYALYLEFLKDKEIIKDWLYEPKKFWFLAIKSGIRNYTPDFQILQLDGKHYWAEVKGHMDSKSKTKISRFKKYYPKEELRVIDKEWFSIQAYRFPFLARYLLECDQKEEQ